MTVRLAERCDVDRATASQAYHASLLMYVGCMTDAHVTTSIFAGTHGGAHDARPVRLAGRDHARRGTGAPGIRRSAAADGSSRWRGGSRARPTRVRPQFAAMCEVAELLADRHRRAWRRAEALPVPDRAVGRQGRARPRAGRRDPARDPADACRARRGVPTRDRWRRPCGRDDPTASGSRVRPRRRAHVRPPRVGDVPGRRRSLIGVGRDPRRGTRAARLARTARRSTGRSTAIGTSAEISSPYLAGHSAGVAERAAAGARACGLDEADVRRVRRAGLLHDVGRVAVHPRVWEMPGPLDADAWEQVRLHAYHARARDPPLPVPRGACGDRLCPPRTTRRERVSPRLAGRRPAPARSAPRRRRRVPGAHGAPRVPSCVRRRSGRGDPPRRSEGRPARRRDGGRRARRAPVSRRRASSARPVSPTARCKSSACWRVGSRRSRWGARSASRSRPPTGTSRTPTGRSASRPARAPRCSRWSTASSHGEDSRSRIDLATPSVGS